MTRKTVASMLAWQIALAVVGLFIGVITWIEANNAAQSGAGKAFFLMNLQSMAIVALALAALVPYIFLRYFVSDGKENQEHQALLVFAGAFRRKRCISRNPKGKLKGSHGRHPLTVGRSR